MIERIDLFHLPFYKKEAFTGSDRGLRFWIGKAKDGEGEDAPDMLRAIVWPEPFALKHTPEEQQVSRSFEFSESGLDEIYDWIMGEGRESIGLSGKES
ncbi:MAG: GNAT family acetyltransferase [Eubacteriales bacterium]|nr:GNAT family acetyltransferase [Eubacteriales bacterium]